MKFKDLWISKNSYGPGSDLLTQEEVDAVLAEMGVLDDEPEDAIPVDDNAVYGSVSGLLPRTDSEKVLPF